jgi:hypothetical protein
MRQSTDAEQPQCAARSLNRNCWLLRPSLLECALVLAKWVLEAQRSDERKGGAAKQLTLR